MWRENNKKRCKKKQIKTIIKLSQIDKFLFNKQYLQCEKNDIRLISGKEHEKHQTMGNLNFYFDDMDVASKILNSLQLKYKH